MTHENSATRESARGFASFAKLAGAAALLAGLAACAGEQPQVPATQEAAQYREHARNFYAAPGPAWDPWGPYIKEAAARFDVPESWIRSVMHQESGGQEFVVSTPGAMGLMQLMPFTYDLMRQQYALGDDPYDPHNNLLAGTAYIRQMYDIYGSPGFLAAYNAGPGRLDDFLTRNRPLPAETRHYVAIIGPEIAFDSPHNRSQADLMAMNHASGGGDAYAGGGGGTGPSPTDPALTHSVQLAWARRGGAADPDAEAQAPAATPTESAEPVRLAAANGRENAASVRAIWLNRTRGADVQTAQADLPAAPPAPAPSSRFTPAPTPAQQGALPDDAATAPAVQLASARIVSQPSAELADSVAEAPDNATPVAAPPRPAASRSRLRFRLVNSAMAETVPPRFSGSEAGGNWAIQVGAFGSASAASQAAGSARSAASNLLGRAHAEIAPLHERRGRVYRARLTGLSRATALRACERLGRGDCMVVSPDGES